MPQPTHSEISAAASALARKGGRRGTGDKKKRDHYHYTVTMPQARARQAASRKSKG